MPNIHAAPYVDPLKLQALLGGTMPPEGMARYRALVNHVLSLDKNAEIRAAVPDEIKRLETVLMRLLETRERQRESAKHKPRSDALGKLSALYVRYHAAYMAIGEIQQEMKASPVRELMKLMGLPESLRDQPTLVADPSQAHYEDIVAINDAAEKFASSVEAIEARRRELFAAVGPILSDDPHVRSLALIKNLAGRVEALEAAASKGKRQK